MCREINKPVYWIENFWPDKIELAPKAILAANFLHNMQGIKL